MISCAFDRIDLRLKNYPFLGDEKVHPLEHYGIQKVNAGDFVSYVVLVPSPVNKNVLKLYLRLDSETKCLYLHGGVYLVHRGDGVLPAVSHLNKPEYKVEVKHIFTELLTTLGDDSFDLNIQGI